MQSMTGYGRKQCQRDGREMTVEVKTVNHRFLDIAFRMPRSLGFLEDPIRKVLSARMPRPDDNRCSVPLSHLSSAESPFMLLKSCSAFREAASQTPSRSPEK